MARAKLFTKEIDRALAKAREPNRAICKIFNPCGAATWVIFGQDPEDPDILIGLCDLGHGLVEWGPVRRSELETFRNRFGLPLERDRYFSNTLKPESFFRENFTHSLVGC